MSGEMFFGKFNTKEEAIRWAMEILTLKIPFCSELMEEKVKKARKILLTFLPDPQRGIKHDGEFFPKDETLYPSPEEAVALILNQ